MNVKLSIRDVVNLFDNEIPLDLIYKQLQPLANNAGLIFSEPKLGSGYLQWNLPGTDWISFADANETQKASVAQEYEKRKDIIRSALNGASIERDLFIMPSEKFIYFRPKEAGWEIAVTAWGHKFPNTGGGGELDTWITKTVLQEVKIAFMWDGNAIPGFAFRLNGMERHTLAHGWYEMDGKLPVGTSYRIEPHTGGAYILTVENGKAEYVYDLTKYVQINITVLKDGIPLNDCNCEVSFNGIQSVTTGQQGSAMITKLMVCDETGVLRSQQPVCAVFCMGEVQQMTPDADNNVLNFVFRFESEVPKPQPPVPAPAPESEPVSDHEPENVHIQLQDYGGFPLPDLDFILSTKKKGAIELRTDSEGVCIVPKEWFTHKERIKVKFKISPEYQEKHDLHDKKIKNK